MPKKIVVTLPQGMEIPEGKETGDTVEFMCEFRIEDSGKLCLTEIEGHALPGYDDSKDSHEETEPQEPKDFAQSYAENAPKGM